MKRGRGFIFTEIMIFVLMGLVTFIEVTQFKVFQSVFTLIKSPSSWFVGLSLGYVCSNFLQKGLFSFFSKRNKDENKEQGDYFIGFILTLVLTSVITPFLKNALVLFFEKFFIYFHIILIQSVIILYVLFKLKNNYKISGRYFVANELITLFYTAIILLTIA